MNTPICDFVNDYANKNSVRLHMPGHKGTSILGIENTDITEISGADELYMPDGIIAESERNASRIFGSETYFSAGGSTLCIQAMLFILTRYAVENHKAPLILAGRNSHRAFINAAALTGAEIEWLYPNDCSYHSCDINPTQLEEKIRLCNPMAVYLTSPDYLGNIADIKKISEVCRRNNVILAVDNAHGSYLRFLRKSIHPIDLGADICCDSAHKTLPVLTGGAYLHISDNAPKVLHENVKKAFSVFGSSSPSYLILQSLDMMNANAEKFKNELAEFLPQLDLLRVKLSEYGYETVGNEPLKITLAVKSYGYTGTEFAKILESRNIFPEFSDRDYVVLMFSPQNSTKDLSALHEALRCIPHRAAITEVVPKLPRPERVLSPRDALFMRTETVSIEECLGRICATSSVSCPPAIPLIVYGEKADETVLENFRYYGIKNMSCCIY